MSIVIDEEYKNWIKDIANRYRSAQIKAAVSVNHYLIEFYWLLGKDIVEKQAENKWGSGFYERLSKDLQKIIPDTQGFSVPNLRFVRRFYDLYTIRSQLVSEITEEELFSVPWGHHRGIITASKGDVNKAIFFIKKTIENNWSRAVLENFLSTDLFERQGKAITNFSSSLPAEQSKLAQEMTKDPYNFDFLTIKEKYDERTLKDALMDNITKFLLEMGRGFAFVGREYPLPIEGTEEYIDLLFYHLWLHCYVVVEVKVTAFKSADIGQTATYVAIADDLIRREGDNKTIGLIICKSKNNVLAKYATSASKEPIGVSEYELSHFLPSTEEIEEELKG